MKNINLAEPERELDEDDYTTEIVKIGETDEHYRDLEEAQTGDCHNLFTYNYE